VGCSGHRVPLFDSCQFFQGFSALEQALGHRRERLLLGRFRLSQGDVTLFFLGDGSERLLLGGFEISPADATLSFQVRKNIWVTSPCERYFALSGPYPDLMRSGRTDRTSSRVWYQNSIHLDGFKFLVALW